ncbi:MAG TPA: aminotransferase class IV [Candidatus Nanopelagicales bacterium]|nr:aminotransferase class IV [Candidatus Nanopelagicales bacterium]
MIRYWLDDGLVDAAEARVSVLDHGLTVGDGVFETILVRRGAPFALTRHLARLQRSLAGLGIEGPPTDRVAEAVAAVVEGSGVPTAFSRLRITVTSGSGPFGSDRGDAAPTLVVTLAEAAPWPGTTTLATVPWARNERSAIAGLKTTSYAENAIALAEAKRRGASEAVLADTQGRLSECTGSNVFVVVDDVVHTPSLDTGCLAGVTRELVLEWGRDIVEMRESHLPYDVLTTADEVFITSSTRDVHPVVRIDDRELPAGPVTTALRAAFDTAARSEVDP